MTDLHGVIRTAIIEAIESVDDDRDADAILAAIAAGRWPLSVRRAWLAHGIAFARAACPAATEEELAAAAERVSAIILHPAAGLSFEEALRLAATDMPAGRAITILKFRHDDAGDGPRH